MTIPRIAHFVFGLREQTEPFHPMHYLAIESCRQVLQPEVIHLHHQHLPFGVYWDLIRPHLELHEVGPADEVLAAPRNEQLVPERYRYAHHADVIRLDALIEHGGVYADIDTLFVSEFPDELFAAPFVIGEEDPVRDELTGEVRPSLCNALLLAEPRATFAVEWRERMAGAMNGTWSNHSGFLAHALSQELPAAVRVEPARSFTHLGYDADGLARLFERLDRDLEGVLSLHLWSHLWWEESRVDASRFHAGLLDEEHIRSVDTTYTVLARRFLPPLDTW
ncbi:MAG: capsular polysaccharide synthesis protein [Actinomycetota bacterium]|nr:capsular polysaccharide synthesis protein [Actinomycetota bacterium]